MGFIFYMSSNIGQISHGQSTKIVSIIEKTRSKLEDEPQNGITDQKKQAENSAAVQKTPAEKLKENKLDHIVRKNAHGFMYMTLAFLVSGGLFAFNKRGKDAIIYIMFICLFYAVTDEFHQAFVPGRGSLVSDILIDFTGALIGMGVFYLFYYKVYRRYPIKKKDK